MVSLADHSRLRLMILCLLYVGKGIPYGFVTVALAGQRDDVWALPTWARFSAARASAS
jgi:hypothetical protein